MKYTVFILAFTFLGACSTTQMDLMPETQTGVEAEFLGQWMARCMICGGYMMDIDGDIYQFMQYPEGAPEDLLELQYMHDPGVMVKVTYIPDPDWPTGKYDFQRIIVSKLEKQ